METRTQPSLTQIDETAALRSIVGGAATQTGERFFARVPQEGGVEPGGASPGRRVPRASSA